MKLVRRRPSVGVVPSSWSFSSQAAARVHTLPPLVEHVCVDHHAIDDQPAFDHSAQHQDDAAVFGSTNCTKL
jgi:hypothetical protein